MQPDTGLYWDKKASLPSGQTSPQNAEIGAEMAQNGSKIFKNGLKRCGICVLWHILSLQASLSGLVNLADSASCRFFRICNLRSSLFFRCQLSLLFGSSDCCSHPPTPLGSLGLLFHESICSFIQGFLVSEQQFGLLTLTTVGAVFPAANCLSSHHQPRPGCQPIYSWWSLVLPE